MQPPNAMPDNARPAVIEAMAWAAASLLLGAVALFVAASHPLWPAAVAATTVAWVLIAYRFPQLWLFALPACLPALNFSPWTGWIGIEEFDLFVLASVSAAYARLAFSPVQRPPLLSRRSCAVVLAVAGLTLAGLWRGVVDAGGWQFAWFQGYTEPLNSLRVGKSALHALLLLPLLQGDWFADRVGAFRRFALGMLCGAGVLTLAVLWERAAFPGLLNLLAHYRTVGLFWEMHVGGAAIDAYVVICTPFVAWALWAARTKWAWLAAALFALVWAYAAMTTFSRGAYLGVATTLLVLGLQWRAALVAGCARAGLCSRRGAAAGPGTRWLGLRRCGTRAGGLERSVLAALAWARRAPAAQLGGRLADAGADLRGGGHARPGFIHELAPGQEHGGL
jgi:hypothetical protein